MLKIGQYTAHWELATNHELVTMTTQASLDTDTYKIKAKYIKGEDLGSLIKETFDSNGEVYDVCGICHQTVLINNRCPDENCESNK